MTYTSGRESEQTYGETLAGVRTTTPKHQFGWPMPAYRDDHQLYPEVRSEDGVFGATATPTD